MDKNYRFEPREIIDGLTIIYVIDVYENDYCINSFGSFESRDEAIARANTYIKEELKK